MSRVPFSVERAILRHTVTPADVLARLNARFMEDALPMDEDFGDFDTAPPIDYEYYSDPSEGSTDDEELRALTAEIMAEDAKLRGAA